MDGGPSENLVVIACDESGSEGERLVESSHDVFTHASVSISHVEASEIVRELRQRAPSQAPEFKSPQLLARRNRAASQWLFGADGPLAGRGHVHLTEKSYFVFGKVIDLLVEELTYESGVDLYAGGRAKMMADTLYREGPRAFDAESWQSFQGAFNSLMRAKDRRQAKISVDEFFAMVDGLRLRSRRQSIDRILDLLWRTRSHANAFQDAIASGATTIPALDPLFAALPLAASYWSEGKYAVGIVHDTQSALTAERIRLMVRALANPHPSLRKYWTTVNVKYLEQVDSRVDARVQVADLLAGVARVWASGELAGNSDPATAELLRPYVDQYSLWGDEASWGRISPSGS